MKTKKKEAKKPEIKPKTGKNGKHPGGRPTKYDPKYCKEIIEFFNVDLYRKEIIETRTIYKKDGSQEQVHKYQLMPNRLPTIAKFARSIKVNKTTIYEWVNEHPEFSNSFMEARDLYAEFLAENGLSKLYDSSLTQFMLRATTDLRDKTETPEGTTLIGQVQVTQNVQNNNHYGPAIVEELTKALLSPAKGDKKEEL